MRSAQQDWYALLGVPLDASLAVMRRAYRQQLRRLHPDVRPTSEQGRANDELAQLNLAYEILSDERRRRGYDQGRHAAGPSPVPPASPPPPPDIVAEPISVDFGPVRIGETPCDQQLVIRLSDGSTVTSCELLTPAGPCWAAEIVPSGATPVVVVWLRSKLLPSDTVLGIHIDELRLRVQQINVTVPVTMTVLEPRHRVRGRRRGRHAATFVAVVLCALVSWVMVHGRLGGNTASVAKQYCELSTEGGRTLSYFRTRAGTTERTGPAVWATRAGNTRRDAFVYWWTPAFPYWERANVQPGLARDGWTYGRYEYVEALVDKKAGWEPLEGLYARRLPIDTVAERKQRLSFLTDWIGKLDGPRCDVAVRSD